MPISYTKRGWTNNSPPAINAANLGAMDDALKLTADKVDTIAEGADVTAAALASAIEGGTPTTTPDDTDKLPGVKSDHSRLYYTWANIKTALGSVFASLTHASRHQHGGADEIATATPAANVIPKAGADARLDIGFIPAGPSTPQTTDDGLVSLWSFDKHIAGATSVRDDFGTTALPLVGTPSPITGVSGSGMEAVGNTKYGQLAAVPSCLQGTGDWTIGFWFDFGDANLASDVGLFGGAYVTANYYSKGIAIARKGSNGALYAQISAAAARYSITISSYTPSAGFSYYELYRSGTTFGLRINGVSRGTTTIEADFSIAWGALLPQVGTCRFSTTTAVQIAANGTQKIDEVRIYNRAITANESRALYLLKTVSLDPATILALLGGDIVQNSSGRRFKVVAGAIRATGDGTTWEFIENSEHTKIGFDSSTPIEVSGTGIRVNYSELAATKVVSFVVVPDESFAGKGYEFGATVATGYAIIVCGRPAQVIQGYVYYDGAAWQVSSGATQGNVTVDSFSAGGTLKLLHDSISGDGVSVVAQGGGVIASVKTVAEAYTEVEFYDYAGNLITSPSTAMKLRIMRTYPAYQRTMSTLNLPGANVWIFGIFEVA